MRTISNTLRKRLLAEAQEADFHGLEKVAGQLAYIANNNPVRPDDDEYIYSRADLQDDVEKLLWSGAIRVQDYFGKTGNSDEIEGLIESFAQDLIISVRTKIGGDVIGPHEPLVPGERRMIVEIDDSQ